jgi:hypothetical protein
MPIKFIRIVLVFAMLFSTVGVSAASTFCMQKQDMRSRAKLPAACAKCKSAKPTNKSCCKTVYQHLVVKSEYHRPAASSMDAYASVVLAVLSENFTLSASQAAVSNPVATGPPIALGSLDRCSQLSTFRI